MMGRSYGQLILMTVILLFPWFILSWALAVYVNLTGSWQSDNMADTGVFLVCLSFTSIGLMLYWMRENLQILYGLVEILFGNLFLWFLIAHWMQNANETVLTDDASAETVKLVLIPVALQICASLYVMVRGFDNVGKGLQKYPKLSAVWEWFSIRPQVDKREQK